jgi:hypothetical protein
LSHAALVVGRVLLPLQLFIEPVATYRSTSDFPVTDNFFKMASTTKAPAGQRIAIVSVYDKTGLLDLAKGLVQQNVRILASGGTSRMIRESGFPVEYEPPIQAPFIV